MPTRDAPQRRAALTARRKGDSARPGKKRQPAQMQQFQHGDASQLAQRAYALGKTQAHITLDRLLLHSGGDVDVTDQAQFHWNRFLASQTCGAHILPAGRSMERVIAFRILQSEQPALAFCRDDQITFVLIPNLMNKTPPLMQMPYSVIPQNGPIARKVMEFRS